MSEIISEFSKSGFTTFPIFSAVSYLSPDFMPSGKLPSYLFITFKLDSNDSGDELLSSMRDVVNITKERKGLQRNILGLGKSIFFDI